MNINTSNNQFINDQSHKYRRNKKNNVPPQFMSNQYVNNSTQSQCMDCSPPPQYSSIQQPPRPSFPEIFIETCILLSKRSTCQRIKTAALVVKNNNIISFGYNGVPSNHRHCNDFWLDFFKCTKYKYEGTIPDNLTNFYNYIVKDHGFKLEMVPNTYQEFIESKIFSYYHHLWSDVNELHAELNALLQSSNTKDATLYTLYSPCKQCSKSIIAAGIICVVYHKEYDRDIEGLSLLRESKVMIIKL
jgi:dCMP deaminase